MPEPTEGTGALLRALADMVEAGALPARLNVLVLDDYGSIHLDKVNEVRAFAKHCGATTNETTHKAKDGSAELLVQSKQVQIAGYRMSAIASERQIDADVTRCPDCGSHDPRLHPAAQAEGEVTSLCHNAFHGLTAEVTA